MFNKILIANRGEIACRIIRTARAMGVKTVAVYSDADANAQHVLLADQAVYIGGSASRDSYLLGDKVLDAALQTGAQAIHPGYGFLSENAAFSELCNANNVVFIGPPVGAIEAMGSKSAAKQIMQEAGVPLVPGYHGSDQSPATLKSAADQMGYPVLLKAVAGGGGKGMRQVWDSDEFDEALAAAKREALNGFGNDDMLVEKYLTQPRHVEIQVFCDNHGNAVYLFERDCSVQRRHQKVLEEAPAPGMSAELRQAMGEAAVKAAQAIDYRGAGTVEFLLDVDGSFFFMEMNTRLQVEHPVTELITGEDLVEWQLLVADGQMLPKAQHQLTLTGHSVEARIYAEDPDNEFLPATGTLAYLRTPAESAHVRVDSGVIEGDEVSVFYDPMIAKLIVWDHDRDRAIDRLTNALRDYRIAGLTTNIDYLHRIADSQPFRAADLDTRFIERHTELLSKGSAKPNPLNDQLAMLAGALQQRRSAIVHSSDELCSPWQSNNDWRLNYRHQRETTVTLAGNDYQIVSHLRGEHEIIWSASCDGQSIANGTVSCRRDGDSVHFVLDGQRSTATLFDNGEQLTLFNTNGSFTAIVAGPDLGDADSGDAGGGLQAPMNGTIVAHLVEPGASVEAGTTLLVMEAMKMEHAIKAPSNGTVSEFYFAPGELVSGGAELLDFAAE